MDIAILLHLYQPAVQDPAVLSRVVSECYLPLINTIQKNNFSNITFDIPLSLLEQMDKESYYEWIEKIKQMNNAEKVELTGSAAYHPLLPKLPGQVVQEQIILNEYGLGYYFGSTQGFEGEEAMIIQDLNGFFPPELAVNMSLIQQLDDLNYSWVLVDETAFSRNPDLNKNNCLYEIKGFNIKIVKRDSKLSNLISFKRDLNLSDIKDYLTKKKEQNTEALIVALDGEAFGHHNKDGLVFFEILMKLIKELNIDLVKISDIVDGYGDIVKADEISESSWGACAEDIENNRPYPVWEGKEAQNLMWGLQNEIVKYYLSLKDKDVPVVNEYQNAPIWKKDVLEKMNDNLAREIESNLIFHKSLNSDKFWWLSNKKLGENILYNPGFVEKSLDLFVEYIVGVADLRHLQEDIKAKINEIKDILK